MNEQIIALATKAFRRANDGTMADIKIPKVFIDEFADLIVFECTKAVQDGTKEGDHYAQRIEQHFNNTNGGILHSGVEE